MVCFIFGYITFYMNFLAHSYLSPKVDLIMLGNLSGDFVKGKSMEGIQIDIATGARLHRAIDTFTDNHPDFKAAKRIIAPKFNHYSGVLIDMFFDYFLAKKWNAQAPLQLQQHIKYIYKVGTANSKILPLKFQPVLLIMIQYDWLSMYYNHKGLKKILTQMTYRIKHKSLLYESVDLLIKNEADLECLFDSFWLSITTEFETFPNNKIHIGI